MKKQRLIVPIVLVSGAEIIEHSEPSLGFCTFAEVLTRIHLIICPYHNPA